MVSLKMKLEWLALIVCPDLEPKPIVALNKSGSQN